MGRRKKGKGEEIYVGRRLRENYNEKKERESDGQDEIEEGVIKKDERERERDGKVLPFLFSL